MRHLTCGGKVYSNHFLFVTIVKYFRMYTCIIDTYTLARQHIKDSKC